MYIPKHFGPKELVPPEVYEELKDTPWRIWAQFDDLFLVGIDLIWEHYNGLLLPDWKVVIVINDWSWGGHIDSAGEKESWTRCGLRPGPVLPGEAKWGQHPRGGAGDLHLSKRAVKPPRRVIQILAEEARQEILRNKAKFAPYIRRMERDVNWLHVDRANYGDDPNEIYLIDPV